MSQIPHPFDPYLSIDKEFESIFGDYARCRHSIRFKQKMNFFDFHRSPSYADLMDWMAQHVKGNWFRLDNDLWQGDPRDYDHGSVFYFENASEAVHFKLRWYDPEPLG